MVRLRRSGVRMPESVKLSADPCRVRMVQVFEYRQGVLPGLGGIGLVPGCAVDVAQAHEHQGFFVAVAEQAEYVEGAVVAVVATRGRTR
jgi:hypothetical protein